MNKPLHLSCKLTSPELQERKRTVIVNLKNLVLEKIETENGFRFKFEGSDQVIDQLTTFIKTERLCCDFFKFELSVGEKESFTWLELTGPEGTKEFIESEVGF